MAAIEDAKDYVLRQSDWRDLISSFNACRFAVVRCREEPEFTKLILCKRDLGPDSLCNGAYFRYICEAYGFKFVKHAVIGSTVVELWIK